MVETCRLQSELKLSLTCKRISNMKVTDETLKFDIGSLSSLIVLVSMFLI